MEDRLPRKLAAILYADVAGYSRLTGEDEDATHRTLSEYLDLIAGTVSECRGQVMHYAGDAVLAKFDAVLDAVTASVAVQKALNEKNDALPDDRRLRFRIGVNLGDVIEDRGDIYGDGVNVAARLEALAEPGCICISDAVRTALGNKLPLTYNFMGEHAVKNIAEPVRAYRVFEAGAAPAAGSSKSSAGYIVTAPRIGKPSLAIKPFKNLSADPAQDPVAYTLSNGIIAALSKLPGLALIQDESPGLRESNQMPVEEIARRFDVQYVLRGGIQQLGDRIRANAELMGVESGRYVWAEQFDRRMQDIGDLFDIQDEIVEEIVTTLDVKLLHGEAARLVRKTFTNPTALETYAHGEDMLWSATTKPELDEAKRLLEDSIRLEPDCPTGYACAGLAHFIGAVHELSDSPSESISRAVELSREALTREDLTGYPHIVTAHVHLNQREYDKAMTEASLAVTDRPSCPGAYSLKASVLNYLGRPKDAIELAEYATRLSPLRPPTYAAILPTAYFACGRFEDAVAAAQAAIGLDARNVDLYIILSAALAAIGRADEARRAAERVLELKPDFTLDAFEQTQPYKERALLDVLLTHLQSAGLS